MTEIGIPYAPEQSRDNGQPYITCPECGEEIDLHERKDFESMTGSEYANHYLQHKPQPNVGDTIVDPDGRAWEIVSKA